MCNNYSMDEAHKDSMKMSNGVEIPTLGFGTWQVNEGPEAEGAVRVALEAGYRHIDTARLYGNEWSVGKAVRESGIPREEIFVTTKIWPTDFFDVRGTFDEGLKRLGFDYVDMYLIHWPIPFQPKAIWQALEKIYDDKLARAIGVSNYGTKELAKLFEYARIKPMNNQVRYNPFHHDDELLAYCRDNDIVFTSYSPLNHGYRLKDPVLVAIAEKYGKTTSQVCIRWTLQKGTISIPKSTHPGRIKENADVFNFELSVEDMEKINALG